MIRNDEPDDAPAPHRDRNSGVGTLPTSLHSSETQAPPPGLEEHDQPDQFSLTAIPPLYSGTRLLIMGLFLSCGFGLILAALWPGLTPPGEASPGVPAAALPPTLFCHQTGSARAQEFSPARCLNIPGKQATERAQENPASPGDINAPEADFATQTDLAPSPEAGTTVVSAPAPDRDTAPAILPTNISGNWTVSLMTLSNHTNAEDYARRVRAQGWPASVNQVGRQRQQWRVSSGNFFSSDEANAHASAIAHALNLDSVWVTRHPEP